ncbi:SH3 domain-containing protein [Streptomyces bungoensis]|uniref:SH3 domain-containing protein n=1 Tax=Streptomyces bungoensis TaxID=285568 RepID=UPI00341EA5C1
MVRRTLKSALLTTVAVLAFLPGAAAATPASAAPYPVPAQHRVHPSHPHAVPAAGRVVTHGARLNVRSGPGTGYRVIGHRHAHRLLALRCRTFGSGVYGNHLWYRLRHHRGYVSARYVHLDRTLPWC